MKSLWLPNNTEICIMPGYVVLWHQRLAQVHEISGAGQCWWWSNLHAFSVGIEFFHWYNCMGISNYFCQKLDLEFNSVFEALWLAESEEVGLSLQAEASWRIVCEGWKLTNSWMHVWGNKCKTPTSDNFMYSSVGWIKWTTEYHNQSPGSSPRSVSVDQ